MPGNSRSGGDRKSQGGDDQFPSDGLPQKPATLQLDESQVWDQLMDQIPAELLRGIDVYQLQVLCEVTCQKERVAKLVRDDPTELPAYRVYIALAQHISRLSSQFGLSPVDRKRLDFEEPIQDDAEEWASQG